jgi:hypothetical protein
VALIRKQVGDAERYQGRRLVARHMGPDLLAYVNDVELASFYINVESAIAAGRRYVDDEIKEETKRAGKQG